MEIDGFTLAATTDDLTREEEAREKADVIEFRMDKAENPIEQLEAYDGELPIVATNRNQWFGGKARDTGRLDTLFAASRFDSVAYVDIELETARAKEWILEEFRDNDVGLIISHHDFDTTPEKEVLTAIIDQCAGYGDIAQVAVYPEALSDTLTLLTVLHEATQAGIDAAGIAMGETGSHTRVVGHIYGSKLGVIRMPTQVEIVRSEAAVLLDGAPHGAVNSFFDRQRPEELIHGGMVYPAYTG
jgi:3-dehydroquinate dehydratase-1